MQQVIYQAITTRYIPATDTKPTRVCAECAAKRIYLSRDSLENQAIELCEGNGSIRTDATIGILAALHLAYLLDWEWTADSIATGCIRNGDYVHVQRPAE